MVGRLIHKKSITGAECGIAEIVSYTSTTQVKCEILYDFDSANAMAAGSWYLTTDSVSGLDHLDGEVVSIVTDGGLHPNATVTDGAVSLDGQYAVVHVGLPYTGYLETNELEGGGTTGTAQTKKKNVCAVGFRFLDTLYAKYGTDYYNLNQIEFRTPTMRMDRPPIPYTGDRKEQYKNDSSGSLDAGWARSKRASVMQDLPFPCTVQLIIPYFSVSN
jgi:hypothetical protein